MHNWTVHWPLWLDVQWENAHDNIQQVKEMELKRKKKKGMRLTNIKPNNNNWKSRDINKDWKYRVVCTKLWKSWSRLVSSLWGSTESCETILRKQKGKMFVLCLFYCELCNITSHDEGIPAAAWCCEWRSRPADSDQQNPSRWPAAECTVNTRVAAVTVWLRARTYDATFTRLYLHFASLSRKHHFLFLTVGVLLYGGKALTSPLPRGTLMMISSVPPAMGEPFTEMLYTFSLWRGTRTAGVLGNLARAR